MFNRIQKAQHFLDRICRDLKCGQVRTATGDVVFGGFYTGYEYEARSMVEAPADLEEALLAMEIRIVLQQVIKLECIRVHLTMSRFGPPPRITKRAEMEGLYMLAGIVAVFDPLSVVEAKRVMNASAKFVGATFDSLMTNFYTLGERKLPEF